MAEISDAKGASFQEANIHNPLDKPVYTELVPRGTEQNSYRVLLFISELAAHCEGYEQLAFNTLRDAANSPEEFKRPVV